MNHLQVYLTSTNQRYRFKPNDYYFVRTALLTMSLRLKLNIFTFDEN